MAMRETFDGAWPRLNRGAASMPMAPAKRTLRRVITVHLVDERSSAIVRLQGELSAANDRLLLAVLCHTQSVTQSEHFALRTKFLAPGTKHLALRRRTKNFVRQR